MIIIGITGTLGAGKGTVVEFLQKNYGFSHFSARDLLVKEIEKRGMEVNRDSMVMMANELRKNFGSSFVADELYRQAAKSGKDCVIESLRTPGEIEALRNKEDFYLVAVDADPKLRYERIQKRWSETDDVSYEKFLADEEREMDSNDPNKQNLKKCIEMADYVVENNGTIEDLNEQVEKILKIIEENEKNKS